MRLQGPGRTGIPEPALLWLPWRECAPRTGRITLLARSDRSDSRQSAVLVDTAAGPSEGGRESKASEAGTGLLRG